MKQDCLFIGGLTKEFLLEVYYRVENDSPDNSVEYSESIEMTTFELAEQVVTGQAESDEDAITIPIDKSIQDLLEEIYETYEDNDGELFYSYELTETMEQFLYNLGRYLIRGDYNELFAIDRY
jgi:hypothetical protein